MKQMKIIKMNKIIYYIIRFFFDWKIEKEILKEVNRFYCDKPPNRIKR